MEREIVGVDSSSEEKPEREGLSGSLASPFRAWLLFVTSVKQHRNITTQTYKQTHLTKISWLVSWYFKPSQPQRIISGLRETFIDRYIVESTNKAERRPEE